VNVVIGILFAANGTRALRELVSECTLTLFCVGVAASAGVGGKAVCAAGRSGNYALVIVTGSLDYVCLVGITASAGVGGVSVLGTGRSGNGGDVVVDVVLAGSNALCIEGDEILIGVACGVGAPVVLGSIPLKIGGTAGVKYEERAVVLGLKSPALVLAVLVQRGIGVGKSEYVAGEGSEGVASVVVNGNYEYLGIGYVIKVICGIINALVVVRAGADLVGRKKLVVSRCGNKNAIAVLELGNESPIAGGSGGNVGLSASALAVDEGVTESLYLVSLVGVTASAGVGGEALLGAGGSGNNALVGVTESLYLVSLVGVSASAGVGGEALLGAGGSGNNALVGVTESFALGRSAFAGSGGGACCIAKYVFVYVISLAGSKA
jgi:hypothetical protein